MTRTVNFQKDGLDGIMIPPDFSPRPDGTSFWDWLVSIVDQQLRRRLLEQALNEWFSGPNAPSGINDYNTPPVTDHHQALVAASIDHTVCEFVSISLDSVSFDILQGSSGGMVYSADQTWKVTVKYE